MRRIPYKVITNILISVINGIVEVQLYNPCILRRATFLRVLDPLLFLVSIRVLFSVLVGTVWWWLSLSRHVVSVRWDCCLTEVSDP